MKKVSLFISFVTFILISCSKSGVDITAASTLTTPIAVQQPVVTPPVAPNTVNVGDGSSNLIISGSYPSGTTIVVKPGTYNKGAGITINNLSNVTVQLTGVILDGLNQTQAGFYNALTINSLTNVTISGGTTQNCGYHDLYINGRNTGVVLTGHTFKNNLQGISATSGIIWDGTDNTVALLNCAIRNCSFINCEANNLGGNITGSTIKELVKNMEISGCTFKGGNAMLFNNVIDSINLNMTNDNRLFLFVGTASVHDNTVTHYQGHFAGVWSVSFGTTVETSNFYNNTCSNGRRYSAFEFQEFAMYAIPGKTTHADLVVNNNNCSNLNLDHWNTGFNASFIDNYQYGLMGGSVTLTNNTGSNFFPVPAVGIYWNLAKPSVVNGNTYE
jgi:hypothetical protein